MTRQRWSSGDGLNVEPAFPGVAGYGVFIRAERRCFALGSELTRHLAAWLTAHVGALPPPADPCAVRLAIDAQRAALHARSELTDDDRFRAGLAWCDNALDAIRAGHTNGRTIDPPCGYCGHAQQCERCEAISGQIRAERQRDGARDVHVPFASTMPPQCRTCVDDAYEEQAAPWPCATATALGADPGSPYVAPWGGR